MKSGPPRAIGELLLGALPQLGDRLLVQRMRRTWSAVVGADVARRAQPQALVNGCLTIVVDNSPWLHELNLRAADLTERLRAAFPAVQTLRFNLGAAAAAAISDPALAASARRLLARAWPPAPARGNER